VATPPTALSGSLQGTCRGLARAGERPGRLTLSCCPSTPISFCRPRSSYRPRLSPGPGARLAPTLHRLGKSVGASRPSGAVHAVGKQAHPLRFLPVPPGRNDHQGRRSRSSGRRRRRRARPAPLQAGQGRRRRRRAGPPASGPLARTAPAARLWSFAASSQLTHPPGTMCPSRCRTGTSSNSASPTSRLISASAGNRRLSQETMQPRSPASDALRRTRSPQHPETRACTARHVRQHHSRALTAHPTPATVLHRANLDAQAGLGCLSVGNKDKE
jgi:hypothetical protein